MNLNFSTSTKLMAAGIALSLGWFLLESCDCEEKTNQENFPGLWIACIGNKPTLMAYSGNSPSIISKGPAGDFDPREYDCSHPNSPQYKGSEASSPFEFSGPAGPGGYARKPHASTESAAFLPQQIRLLPFVPFVTPAANPTCDSSYPDVFQAIHTLAIVTRYSTCPFKVVATIPVVTRPLQIQITPDGSTALVTSFENAVNFIDVATNKVTYTLKTDQSVNPHGLAISSDGTRAYITSFNATNPEILVIDLATKSIVATIPTNVYPQGATLSPDGSQLWITSPLAQTVDIFDTLTNTRVTSLVIALTTDVAFTSDGTSAFVTSESAVPGTVVEVNTTTYQIVKTYTVGSGPADISMSYADQFLVVNNSGDGSVSVIDLNKDSVSTVKVGDAPAGIAFVH